jgi:hypothetical protein
MGLTTLSNGSINTAASATFFGTVQFGLISGGLSAQGSESSSAEPVGIPLNATFAGASFDGVWQDSLTVTSLTLAAGTPVQLAFTLGVDATLNCGGPSAEASALGAFQAGSNQIILSSTTCNSVFQKSDVMIVNTAVGSDLQVEGQLVLSANAEGYNQESSSAGVDPPSSNFFVDSLTPGASYITGSGNTYFSPTSVPEPGTVTLLSSGLLALAGVTLFRNRIRRSPPNSSLKC